MPEKSWFGNLTPKLQRLTIIFAFIAATGSAWAVLKVAGIDVLDFTIGCSSLSSQTEQNSNAIDTLKIKAHWKWLRQDTINSDVERRIKDLENNY
jgi:hypothetical protein